MQSGVTLLYIIQLGYVRFIITLGYNSKLDEYSLISLLLSLERSSLLANQRQK